MDENRTTILHANSKESLKESEDLKVNTLVLNIQERYKSGDIRYNLSDVEIIQIDYQSGIIDMNAAKNFLEIILIDPTYDSSIDFKKMIMNLRKLREERRRLEIKLNNLRRTVIA